MVGKGERTRPIDEAAREILDFDAMPDAMDADSAVDGEVDLILSGVGLPRFTGSAVFSCDMPGRPMPPLPEFVSIKGSSPWFLLYAAEPRPRSGVCLNHEGSFEPSDWAICTLDALSPMDAAGSRICGEGLAVPSSEPIDDRGRPVGTVEPRDEGRCCHESVPARDGATAALGDCCSSV